MLDKLKSTTGVLVIVIILSWVLCLVGLFLLRGSYASKLEAKDVEIATLTEKSAVNTVTGLKVVSDVPAGKKIEETDLESAEVSENVVGVVQDASEIIGKYYKLNLSAGHVLTTDLIYEDKLTDDLRLFDIVTHMNPIGLKAGSFVDIRIQMPLGEDYIGIAHRQVKEINTGVLKIAVTENDIHTYNSMLVDSILYPGTQIYAVEYVEGAVQKAAQVYYPKAKNVTAIAQKDPNLLNAIKEDMLARRGILESGLKQAGVGIAPRDAEELSRLITAGKENVTKYVSESQKVVDREREEFEKQQAENAAAE